MRSANRLMARVVASAPCRCASPSVAACGQPRSSRAARGTYVLPIKRAIRRAEALDAGDIATVTVALLGF